MVLPDRCGVEDGRQPEVCNDERGCNVACVGGSACQDTCVGSVYTAGMCVGGAVAGVLGQLFQLDQCDGWDAWLSPDCGRRGTAPQPHVSVGK